MKSITTFITICAFASIAAANGIFPTKGAVLANALKTKMPAPAQEKVNYYGGAVISHAKVYVVFWGDNVDATVKAQIANFYATALNSTYVDWLQEYNTRVPAISGVAGTNQDVGRGTVGGTFTITPFNTGTQLDKTAVQAELENQIAAGKLPAPDADSLYMIHYPPGITLLTGGEASCSAWCGDHEGFKSAKYGDIYYAMLPDIGGMCATGCGFASTSFDSMTVIASHELVESITDPMCPDIGVNPAFPAAWLAADQNEVGDLCVNSSGTITSGSTTYAIQGIWDNTVLACKGGTFQGQ